MVEHGDGAGFLRFEELDAEFFSASAAINFGVGAFDFATDWDDFSGFWVGGESAIVNGVGVVLSADLFGFAIDVDDEVAAWIEVDVAVGEFVIEGGNCFNKWIHGMQSLDGFFGFQYL